MHIYCCYSFCCFHLIMTKILNLVRIDFLVFVTMPLCSSHSVDFGKQCRYRLDTTNAASGQCQLCLPFKYMYTETCTYKTKWITLVVLLNTKWISPKDGIIH